MIRAALDAVSRWAIPVLLVAIPFIGIIKKVKVYDVFIDGAKEGFAVAVRIIPFLVGILVAIGMFRGSGAMDLLTEALRPVLSAVHFPPEVFPLAVLRSLSGSGSLALATDLVKQFDQHYQAAIAALRKGDLAGYAAEMEQADKLAQQIVAQSPTPAPTHSP